MSESDSWCIYCRSYECDHSILPNEEDTAIIGTRSDAPMVVVVPEDDESWTGVDLCSILRWAAEHRPDLYWQTLGPPALSAPDTFKAGPYTHFKGGRYIALGLVSHHDTREPMVVYMSHEHGTLNVRPLDGWSGDESGWRNLMPGRSIRRFEPTT